MEEVMKQSNVVTGLIVALVVLLSSHAIAMSPPGQAPTVALDGRLNCPYISTHGGTAYLQISLSTTGVNCPERRPMNVAVVLDRSGSMADAGKLGYAKDAVLALIDQLAAGDIFSLVIYDDIVDVPFPAGRVGNKSELRRLVDGIYPRGATNLGGGMTEGFRQVERNLCRESVNRVILLSDGLANRGMTDPFALGKVAGCYRQKSISLTTMGVGLEYNENLMVDLSRAGGGNYYFIESPNSLASIMSGELNTLSCVVVQNAWLELTLRGGVKINDVIGCERHDNDGTVIIPVGDLYARDRREFTVELSIPEGRGILKAVTGELRCESERIPAGSRPTFTAFIHYTTDAAIIEKNKDWDTQARADVALSTRSVDRAMNLLDVGQAAEAGRTLSEAQEALAVAPAAAMSVGGSKLIRDQASKIEKYSHTLKEKESDPRLIKKSIQFDNYQTQRKK